MKNKHKFTRKQQLKLVSQGEKGCSTCGEVLPLEYFGYQDSKLGYRPSCKHCKHVRDAKKYNREVLDKEYFNNRVVNKEEHYHTVAIANRYDIDYYKAAEFLKIEKCQICNKTKEDQGKRLSIDHCHNTGTVRGVLCDLCNKGLGAFKDNQEFLTNAIYYLEKFNEKK